MKSSYFLLFSILVCAAGCSPGITNDHDSIIASGQMPNMSGSESGDIHLVFGEGDSILYSFSSDKGKTFSSPELVSVVKKLAASHMRGPQIAVTTDGVAVTACNNSGNIFSFVKEKSGTWSAAVRVNDVDTIAKENLMALTADGNNVFAVWLDLRNKHNQIFGSRSTDGGRSWSKNTLIYASPDTTVCECCKPSVAMKGNNISVMFRNWLDGNRDMYLIQSSDDGVSFGQAQKIGTGSWALNGCPMDGGGLALDKSGNAQIVFQRKASIYACEPGKDEKEIGKGRHCTLESVNGKNVYAWVEEGNVVVMKPQGMKKNLGAGQLPILRALNNEHVICVWEKDKQIHKEVIEL